MKNLLTEWKQFLFENNLPKFTAADVKKAIKSYAGKKIGKVDFSIFLNKMASVESTTYNPYAKSSSGTYLGAFQIGPNFYGTDPSMAYDPKKAANVLYQKYSKSIPSLFSSNAFLRNAVNIYGEYIFLYLVHQQGNSGAVRIIYTAAGYEKNLGNVPGKGTIGDDTLKNMRRQGVDEINKVLDDPSATNQQKAQKFISYFKNKYGF